MSVGVGRERIAVGAMGVNVGGMDVCAAVGREEVVAVGKTSTEKVQAFSNSVVNMQPMIGRNHLHCFIAFSLSAMYDMSGLLIAYRWNDYKSFVTEINQHRNKRVFTACLIIY